MGRRKATLVLDSELREQLEGLANSRSLPVGLVRRAKIILLSASGKTNREIARQLETEQGHRGPVAATILGKRGIGKIFATSSFTLPKVPRRRLVA
jgi:hypothetical protein